MSFVSLDSGRRGTIRVNPTAIRTDVAVAAAYAVRDISQLPEAQTRGVPVPISSGVISMDLLALLKFTCTLISNLTTNLL